MSALIPFPADRIRARLRIHDMDTVTAVQQLLDMGTAAGLHDPDDQLGVIALAMREYNPPPLTAVLMQKTVVLMSSITRGEKGINPSVYGSYADELPALPYEVWFGKYFKGWHGTLDAARSAAARVFFEGTSGYAVAGEIDFQRVDRDRAPKDYPWGFAEWQGLSRNLSMWILIIYIPVGEEDEVPP